MNVSPILRRTSANLTLETFDATNPTHMDAFANVAYDKRQHPTLRFELEHPFVDVRVMMLDKIARVYTDQVLGANRHVTI